MEVAPNFTDKAKRDLDLVENAKKGDQKAFAELMGYYRDSIYYLLFNMVKSSEDAEDLTLEAFGKAFKSLHQYIPNYAFSTWLFKIASNKGVDFLRKRRNKVHHISLHDNGSEDNTWQPIHSLKASGPTPEESMISKQKSIFMRKVIEKLKPPYKEIIEMRYLEELSYLEIAEQLELPVGTVKARLHRGRELMLVALKSLKEGGELRDN
ncbi:MAG: sigma-70 family RNA polymerase sigma factor [Bacteroidales bacterium]|nr:sigma-70 family RNA polymerase sigma factor [Bacteroidales bacterium]